MEKIKVLIADDHRVVREGLAAILKTKDDINVVGEAQDGMEAVEKTKTLMPDVILMDVSMPRMGGVEATRQIKREFPHMGIVALTGWLWVDVIATFLVVLLIGKAGWGILRHTGSLLVDTAPYEQDELSAIVCDMGEVVRARSRGSRDAAHIDIDLKVPAEMTIAHSDKLACIIRKRLENTLGGVAEVEVHFMPQ